MTVAAQSCTLAWDELAAADHRPPAVAAAGDTRCVLTPRAGIEVLADRFDDGSGAQCLFLRTGSEAPPSLRLEAHGAYRVESCAAGGWLLRALEPSRASYWLPVAPAARALEPKGRIVAESSCTPSDVELGPHGLAATLSRPAGRVLDLVAWVFPAAAQSLVEELAALDALERTPTYTWSARDVCASPADVYRYLVHGHVYQSTFAWPRKWRFCCELDGYELYLRLRALELAGGKRLYGLLRRQLVLATLARQAPDGAWYHGEWTDGHESHYRFLAGALLLLAAAHEERPDATLAAALRRGTDFLASRTDRTVLGTWFLHDSLEQSPALMDEMERMFAKALPGQKGRGAWHPTRFLGKSPTNKLILNTHVDTTVTLARAGEVTGDDRHRDLIASAAAATRAALALRPAETLYRLTYAAVDLTLLPREDAKRLPLHRRIVRRFASKHLLRHLYRLKWWRPRFAMPGGYIDRHLSPIHYDVKYHAVNVLDLVRAQRRWPDDAQMRTIERAVQFVVGHDYRLLRWWAEEAPRRFSVVMFAEAMIHLCTIDARPAWRAHLARALCTAMDAGLGLPPSAWGTNPEIAPPSQQVPCPVPDDPRLVVVNLCRPGEHELLVVNVSRDTVMLGWARAPAFRAAWRLGDADTPRSEGGSDFSLGAGSWAIATAAG